MYTFLETCVINHLTFNIQTNIITNINKEKYIFNHHYMNDVLITNDCLFLYFNYKTTKFIEKLSISIWFEALEGA